MAALSNGSDGPPARPSKKLAPRLRASCEACRKRKSRCDGTQPCHRYTVAFAFYSQPVAGRRLARAAELTIVPGP